MGVLADVEAILLRATFTDEMESTHLKDLSLDDSVRQYTPNGIVQEVEECRCPAGYDGLSCEVSTQGASAHATKLTTIFDFPDLQCQFLPRPE